MHRFAFLFCLFTTILHAAEKAVTWDPLGPLRADPDTLLMPDLTSVESVEKQGGFAMGVWQEKKAAAEIYDFGPGRSGPAFRGKVGAWTFHNWPCDGLIPGDEFTIECSFKADQPWAELWSGRGFFSVSGGNQLDVYNDKADLVIIAKHLSQPGERRLALPVGQWSLDDRKWHALGLTWKNRVLTVWLDGKQAGQLKDVPWGPLWSDGTHAEGIMLGGTPGIAKWLWVSDLRISRTARIPGQPVALRPLNGSLAIDTTKPRGTVPPHLLGALHPTTIDKPGVISQGLQVIRTDKILVATPMKRGGTDAAHPSKGRSGRFAYDWQVCDRTMDWMKNRKVQVFISIDATPQILGGNVPPFSGEQLATGLSGESGFGPIPPNNLEDWTAIVGDLVHHIRVERKDSVLWWGVWNEPAEGGFWNAGLDPYLDLYAATVKAVRAVDPQARVGGPEVAGPWDSEKGITFIQALINRCAKDGLPIDFISYHDYIGSLLTPEQVQAKVAEWSKAAGLATPPPLLIGEFNWAAENFYLQGKPNFNQGMWHLRAFGAAYTTAFLTRLVALGGIESLIFSHTSYGDPRTGGWFSTQLMGPKAERWAPFNALVGWKSTMAGELLATPDLDLPPGVFAAASRDAKTGRIGVALANYGFAQRQERKVSLLLSGLRSGTCTMRRHLVDPTHSSRWDLAEDRPEGAKADELEKVEERQLTVSAAKPVRIELTLPAWSSTFIELLPTGK